MAWARKGEVRLGWQEEIQSILIQAGTDGVKQSVLTKRFDNWIEADDVLNELNVLAAQNKVQKFIIPGRGRPATIWRATTLILKP